MVNVIDVPGHRKDTDPNRAVEVACRGAIAAKACRPPACVWVEEVCQDATTDVTAAPGIGEAWSGGGTAYSS
jgi:hypothetical protein